MTFNAETLAGFFAAEGAPLDFSVPSLSRVDDMLSFGLLAVSTTPAIHAFGVTMGAGVGLVWLLSPLSQTRKP